MKINLAFSLLVGTLFSLITLYFAFKNVPFAELIQYLASVNYFWIIPSTLVVILGFLLSQSQKTIFKNKFATFASNIIGNIVSGFALENSPNRIYSYLLYSVFICILSGYSYYMQAKG
jgi:hypothetical protein